MRTIALINQKGGVGKTTTAANLGGGLARLGHSVLLVDIDPQANLSLHLNVDSARREGKSIYDLLVRNAPVEETIVATGEENLQLIPSHIDLCSAELELVNTVGREVILRDALQQYASRCPSPPDYLLIDCPPSLGILSLNALALAEEVIIPIQAEFFALQGMGKLMEVVKLVETRLNPRLKISGIVICMYKAQTTLAKEVLNEVESYFGEIVYQSKIRQNIKLAEAPGHGQTIFAYDPYSNGAKDYRALAGEVAGGQEASAPDAAENNGDVEDHTPANDRPDPVADGEASEPAAAVTPVEVSISAEATDVHTEPERPAPRSTESIDAPPVPESLPAPATKTSEEEAPQGGMPHSPAPEEDRTSAESGF